MSSWRASSGGPNAANSGLVTIRNRMRDAERNEWQAAASTRAWNTNIVGTGIQARMVAGTAAQRALEGRLWQRFLKECDADGVLDFYGMESLATRTMVGAGECFVRLRPRRADAGLAVPLQIQLLEGDMVPMLDADVWPGLPRGHRIRSGIELNGINRRTAYWMYRSHPGERPDRPQANQIVRVPAEFVLHLFEPVRPGQLRGVSEFAPVLAKLRSLGNFDDAVLHRQELANLFTAFHIRPAPTGDPGLNPITGAPVSGYSAEGLPLATMEPGTTQELYGGEDVKFSEPPDAGTNYADYMRQQNLGISSGAGGVPYEILSGDIRDVSDRTLRVVINEFRRRCEQRQWHAVIPMLCQPVRSGWARAAALAGAIKTDEIEVYSRVIWQPQGWAYIHPTQDAQAKVIEVNAGFRSRESVIVERGDDPEEVDAQIARDRLRVDRANQR